MATNPVTENNYRALAAASLRLRGLTYRDIGLRLGVGQSQARSLAQRGERLLDFSPRLNMQRSSDT
jgi:transposase